VAMRIDDPHALLIRHVRTTFEAGAQRA
jgi:hypothetical protein